MRVIETMLAEDDRMPWSGRSGALRTAAVGRPSSEDRYPELRGRGFTICVVRKLFAERSLVSYAPNAICTCANYCCGERGARKCRPYLRIELACSSVIYTIDVAAGSAVNLARTQEAVLASGQLIVDVPLKWTVARHGDGGEVNFARV
jgi:hypothetical protein